MQSTLRGCLQTRQQILGSISASISPAGLHRSLTETPKPQYERPRLSTIALWPITHRSHSTSYTLAIYTHITSIDSILLDSTNILYLYNTIILGRPRPMFTILHNYHNISALICNSITIISFIWTHYISLLNCCYVPYITDTNSYTNTHISNYLAITYE